MPSPSPRRRPSAGKPSGRGRSTGRPQGGPPSHPARPSRPARPARPSRPARPVRSKGPRARPQSAASAEGERLQKVLASAGLGSRRDCEELITSGRVEVDRKVVTQLGTRVDPSTQEIRVDGESLSVGRRLYYAVNKPKGVVTTNWDPSRRPRVIDLVPAVAQGARLFPVGRLDLESEGLILVTNDGELANRLTHPRYGVAKTYVVQVAGRPSPEVLAKVQQGVHLAEGVARAERVEVRSHHKDSTLLELVLREGRNREIRRLLARVGHKVMRLVRVAVGPIRLGKLGPGEVRPLTSDEIRQLREIARESQSHE